MGQLYSGNENVFPTCNRRVRRRPDLPRVWAGRSPVRRRCTVRKQPRDFRRWSVAATRPTTINSSYIFKVYERLIQIMNFTYCEKCVIVDLLSEQNDTRIGDGISAASLERSGLLAMTVDDNRHRVTLHAHAQAMPSTSLKFMRWISYPAGKYFLNWRFQRFREKTS